MLIIFILSQNKIKSQIHKYLKKELNGFIEWIKKSKLTEHLKEIDDFKDLYKTYQNIYIPMSRRIYMSMPYHKETEWTYYLVRDVVNEVAKKLDIELKLIRTDEDKIGIHGGIREKVYRDIEESDLLIADLTGNNPNVMNEVGFKMGLDKANGLNDSQTILIVNTKCYYEEFYDKEESCEYEDVYKIDGKLIKNESKRVSFNLNQVKQITFYESHYLKVELEKELLEYFKFYKITKVSK